MRIGNDVGVEKVNGGSRRSESRGCCRRGWISKDLKSTRHICLVSRGAKELGRGRAAGEYDGGGRW